MEVSGPNTDGVIFVMHTEAVDALSSVGVKAPERNTLHTCNSGKKTGKRCDSVIVSDHKSSFFKFVIAHIICLPFVLSVADFS